MRHAVVMLSQQGRPVPEIAAACQISTAQVRAMLAQRPPSHL